MRPVISSRVHLPNFWLPDQIFEHAKIWVPFTKFLTFLNAKIWIPTKLISENLDSYQIFECMATFLNARRTFVVRIFERMAIFRGMAGCTGV